MLRLAILANLISWSLVVSQPLFYAVALTNAQRALSAAAYVELRQRINAVMNRRVPVLYVIALVTNTFVLAEAWRAGIWTHTVAAGLGILCLLADVVLMVRSSVPINRALDGWTADGIPDDWENNRTSWFAAFATRSNFLIAGFVALLAAAALA